MQVNGEKILTTEKPVLNCIHCGNDVKPLKTEDGKYLKFQIKICPECLDKNTKAFGPQKERLNNLNKIAIEQGCPSEKVLKAKSDDFRNYSFDVNKVVADLINGQWFLIRGKTDSGKTHLAAYLFKRILYSEYAKSKDHFVYNSLLNVYEEVLSDLNNPFILNKYKLAEYLFLTFGEYKNEMVSQQQEATMTAKRTLFQILDYRIENKTRRNLKTVIITTYKSTDISQEFDESFMNRIQEECQTIELKQKNYRREKFKRRVVLSE